MFDREAVQSQFDETQARYARARCEVVQADSEQDWHEREAELHQLSRELRCLRAQLDAAP